MPFKGKPIEYKGQLFSSINQLAKFLKVKRSTLHSRIKKGLPQEEWGTRSNPTHIFYKGKKYIFIIKIREWSS